MKHLVVMGVFVGMGVLPTSAYTMDCKKAATNLDHLICSDQRLLSADASMGKAYSALLKSAPDATVQKLLVGSQRRWIKARDEAFGDLDTLTNDQTGDPYTKDDQREILLNAIQQRTRQLNERLPGNAPYPRLVQAVADQRTLASHFSGGPFAGVSVSCEFLPQSGQYTYGCFGTHFYQHNNRVCSVSIDWASGSVSEVRAMANVVDGKPKLAATCRPGENRCSSDDAANTDLPGWSESAERFPGDTVRIYEQLGATALPESDPEMPEEDSRKWLQSCLTDPNYPSNALTQ
ncbi:lysozyme inhibitor LprI family protein [Pseudomonas fuscovaginae UPB0736]|uniref:lysozyme inhibitor LprI family protein n=1 Tax=Pseudomonas asplenii TaxID=53407 RepID=UPI00028909B1|nr:lysozyme inhibitor LprI family protein [Pseudomonas fuscovaginae]UUQ64346.1 lysozyme inhibitor LprI family protein [Pseudomonas fuscovaginae UPB0736]